MTGFVRWIRSSVAFAAFSSAAAHTSRMCFCVLADCLTAALTSLWQDSLGVAAAAELCWLTQVNLGLLLCKAAHVSADQQFSRTSTVVSHSHVLLVRATCTMHTLWCCKCLLQKAMQVQGCCSTTCRLSVCKCFQTCCGQAAAAPDALHVCTYQITLCM